MTFLSQNSLHFSRAVVSYYVISRQCKIEQEKGLLVLIEITSSFKYKFESETSTGSSLLPVYTSSLPISLPLSLLLSPIDSPPSYNNNNTTIC